MQCAKEKRKPKKENEETIVNKCVIKYEERNAMLEIDHSSFKPVKILKIPTQIHFTLK